ncbi:MAG: MBOAT family protein, partial [Lachnospiraceae bacterium]|nr:MBOAT family protein [Lachnospiraceae bacterium]
MQFSSYIFILFFLPVCLSGYFLLGKSAKYEAAKLWLIVMSLWFYGYLDVIYPVFLSGSIIANYVLICLMKKQEKDKSQKQLLTLDISLNIGLLFIFKYFNFFIDNINTLTGSEIPLLKLMLPMGLSFIT